MVYLLIHIVYIIYLYLIGQSHKLQHSDNSKITSGTYNIFKYLWLDLYNILYNQLTTKYKENQSDNYINYIKYK